MSTPRSTTSYEGASSGPKKYEEIKFTFCPECSNLLYPKESDKEARLTYLCRTCQYQVVADQSCVFRNILNSSSGETAGVTQDVGSDPTVSDASPVSCLYCGNFIFCAVCGVLHPVVTCHPSPDAAAVKDAHRDDGRIAPWDADFDPFAEYDEEGYEMEEETCDESTERSYVSDSAESYAMSDRSSPGPLSKIPTVVADR
ncbi:DNA-directed RNA polymerases II, IV and V subunit 9A [Paramyrothecium foliicola]|nr:DNA-directed RNA polymerases II, IV and V subunit 9A [Paramyrothecium foliicola]